MFLITYPKQRIAPTLLATLATTSPVIYQPLRHLLPVILTTEDQHHISNCHDVMITSPYALQLWQSRLARLNQHARVHVLSQEMATMIAALPNPIVIAPQANQASLIQQLESCPLSKDGVWLIGDHSLVSDQVPGTKIVVYMNTWETTDTENLCAQWQRLTFSRVLVTSPSSFQRLMLIRDVIPETFRDVQYYSLGETTKRVIEQADLPVKAPKENEGQVLSQMIHQMCFDAKI